MTSDIKDPAIEIANCTTQNQIAGILRLQQLNLRTDSNLDHEEEGFVSVEHNSEQISIMNTPYPHTIAHHNVKGVVGYALMMLPSLRDEIPMLQKMFDIIESCYWNNTLITSEDYFVMGQVCIDKAYRRQSLFRAMYEHLIDKMRGKKKMIITEIACENKRSLHAHMAIGFLGLHDFIDDSNIGWHIVVKDIKN